MSQTQTPPAISDKTGDARSTRRADTLANRILHAGFIAALVLTALLFADSYRVLITTWAASGMFQFQFLVPPLCALLAWSRRKELARLTATPRFAGLAGVIGLGFVWLLGALANVNLITDVAVIALVPALILGFYGPAITRALTFPLAYLAFAVPVGQFLVAPLQRITAHISVQLLEITGMPVFMSGNYIQTPAALWHVAEACSGIKFFLATTAFGVLYAHLFYARWRRRLVFVACAIVVPVIANGLRVYFTILIGEGFGVEYATGTDHMIFGWQFFGTVLVLLFIGGWPWHEKPSPLNVQGSATINNRLSTSGAFRFAVVALVAVAVAPVWLMTSQRVAASVSPGVTMPATLSGLKKQPLGLIEGPGTRFIMPDQRARAVYGAAGSRLWINYVTYVGNDELFTYGNRVYDPKRWRVDTARVVAGGAGKIPLTAAVLEAKNGRGDGWRLRYVYRVAGHWSTSPLAVKAWRVAYGLMLRPAPVSAVVVATRSDQSGVADVRLTQATAAAARALAQAKTNAAS